MLKGASPKGRGFSKFKRKFDAKVLAELRADARQELVFIRREHEIVVDTHVDGLDKFPVLAFAHQR